MGQMQDRRHYLAISCHTQEKREKIKSMAFNVQSDEYSLITDNGQNKTIPQNSIHNICKGSFCESLSYFKNKIGKSLDDGTP
jgi:hypothetical protein